MSSGDIPLVTVIMPVADEQAHLSRSLRALEDIDYPALEFVLVDDCSRDDSLQILRGWAAGRPATTVIALPERSGVAAAREAAIDAASGDYVWMVDCDDTWEPGILATALVDKPGDTADLICFRARVREPDGTTRIMEGVDSVTVLDGGETARAVLTGRIRGYLWNKIFRTDVLRRRRPSPRTTSQSDFMLLLSCVPEIRTTRLLPDIGYHYLQRAGSISFTDTRQLDNTATCADHALEMLPPLLPDGPDETLARSFRLWFHLLPCAVTPVHQSWPAEVTAAAHAELLPRITPQTLASAVREGQHRVALHALVIRVLGPLHVYPFLYRRFRHLRRMKNA